MKLRALTVTMLSLVLVSMSAIPALAQVGDLSEVPDGKWLGGSGAFEPSTDFDTAEYMWQGPNPTDVDKVYFSGLVVGGRIPWTPNLAMSGGSATGIDSSYAAMFGFWRDCNNDGYIGDLDVPTAYGNWNSGAYPIETTSDDDQVDRTICPLGGPYHPDENTVDEFRWISNVFLKEERPANCPFIRADCFSSYGNDVFDENAKAWFDIGEPEASENVPDQETGQDTKKQYATAHSTLSRFVGENTRDTLESNGLGTWGGIPNIGACDEEREFGGGPSMVVAGEDTGQGSCGFWPVWQGLRLVNDSEGEYERSTPIAQVYDNEDGSQGGDPDTTCDDMALAGGFGMANPDPQFDPEAALVEGSIGGTIDNVMRGTNQLQFVPNADGSCNGRGADDVSGDEERGKDRVDGDMQFIPGKNFHGLAAAGRPDVIFDGFGVAGGPASAWDSPYGGFDGGAKWFSNWGGPLVPGLLNTYEITFYGYVDQAVDLAGGSKATALPNGVSAHTYGDIACPGGFENPKDDPANENGWLCSIDAWADKVNDPDFPGISIGQPYHVRDVDCYDWSPGHDFGTWKDIKNEQGEVLRESCAGDDGTFEETDIIGPDGGE